MKPISGGRYSKDGGDYVQTVAPTGERPCKCREDTNDKVDGMQEFVPSTLPEYPALPASVEETTQPQE